MGSGSPCLTEIEERKCSPQRVRGRLGTHKLVELGDHAKDFVGYLEPANWVMTVKNTANYRHLAHS